MSGDLPKTEEQNPQIAAEFVPLDMGRVGMSNKELGIREQEDGGTEVQEEKESEERDGQVLSGLAAEKEENKPTEEVVAPIETVALEAEVRPQKAEDENKDVGRIRSLFLSANTPTDQSFKEAISLSVELSKKEGNKKVLEEVFRPVVEKAVEKYLINTRQGGSDQSGMANFLAVMENVAWYQVRQGSPNGENTIWRNLFETISLDEVEKRLAVAGNFTTEEVGRLGSNFGELERKTKEVIGKIRGENNALSGAEGAAPTKEKNEKALTSNESLAMSLTDNLALWRISVGQVRREVDRLSRITQYDLRDLDKSDRDRWQWKNTMEEILEKSAGEGIGAKDAVRFTDLHRKKYGKVNVLTEQGEEGHMTDEEDRELKDIRERINGGSATSGDDERVAVNPRVINFGPTDDEEEQQPVTQKGRNPVRGRTPITTPSSVGLGIPTPGPLPGSRQANKPIPNPPPTSQTTFTPPIRPTTSNVNPGSPRPIVVPVVAGPVVSTIPLNAPTLPPQTAPTFETRPIRPENLGQATGPAAEARPIGNVVNPQRTTAFDQLVRPTIEIGAGVGTDLNSEQMREIERVSPSQEATDRMKKLARRS